MYNYMYRCVVLSLLLHVSTNLPPTTSQYLHMYTILSFTVQNGASPLFIASQNGHTDIVDLLLKAGADVHKTRKVFRPVHMLLSDNTPSYTIKDGFAPLVIAAQQGHFHTVHRLLEAGADINYQAEVMRTDS